MRISSRVCQLWHKMRTIAKADAGVVMNILAITYSFVPLQFPATYRLLKWFSHLTAIGHHVTVVSIDPASFPGPKDPALCSLVPEGVKIVEAASRENTLLYRVLRRREDWFYRLFEPRKMEWHAPAKQAIGRLDLDRFDVIYSCSQPHVCHLLGGEVHRQTNLPWVAFFSDPWTDNPYYRARPQRIRDYNMALERSVITSADAIILTCDEMKRIVVGKYGLEGDPRISVLPHCFKTDWPARSDHVPTLEANVINVLLIGNFYGPRSPMPLLRTLGHLDQHRALGDRIRLHLFGLMPEEDRCSPVWGEVKHFVQYHGRVEYLASLALMRAADYLLLIDAPVAAGYESVFFPSKLADYLGAGVPIIGFTPRNGASARILAETGHMTCDFGDEHGVEDIFSRMVAGTLQISPDPDEVQKYDYHRVGDMLAAVLQDACAKHP